MHIGYKKRENAGAKGLRVAIIAGPSYPDAMVRLVQGAESDFLAAGGQAEDLSKVFLRSGEDLIESTAQLARAKKFQAIVVLEALLRDEIPDPDRYAREETLALSRLSRETSVIITTGTICANTLEQIEARIGGAAGHKGREAMTAAIEVSHAVQEIRKASEHFSAKQGVLLLGAAWHDEQVSRLVESAKTEYLHSNGRAEDVIICRAAGSLELPFLASEALKMGKFSLILCFGLILVGGTNHADILSETIEWELSELSRAAKVPVENGALLVSSYADAERLLAGDENDVGKRAMRNALQRAGHHEA